MTIIHDDNSDEDLEDWEVYLEEQDRMEVQSQIVWEYKPKVEYRMWRYCKRCGLMAYVKATLEPHCGFCKSKDVMTGESQELIFGALNDIHKEDVAWKKI